MAKKGRSRTRKRRKPLDPNVEDLRRNILFLNPYSGWVPEGVQQKIMNIVDEDGEAIGELELGSDGFTQVAVVTGRSLVRITYYPGRNHATLRRVTVGK